MRTNMRAILFRAKRIDNGEWVVGMPVPPSPEPEIRHMAYRDDKVFSVEIAYINPSTLCQFTGIHDKNGERIWEGDIVRIHEGGVNFHPDEYDEGVVTYGIDRDYPAFDIRPSLDCEMNGLCYGMIEGCILRLGSIHDKEATNA